MTNDLHQRLRDSGLLPFQARLVERIRDLGRGRFLLVVPAGAGSSTICAALAGELRAQDRASRLLVLCPPATISLWIDAARAHAHLDLEIVDAAGYRRLEARSSPDESPWLATTHAISTWRSAGAGRRRHALTATPWDLVIVDGVTCSTGSQQGELLQELWASSHVGLGVAVSPLEGARSALSVAELWVRDPQTTVLRVDRSDVVNWSGLPLLAQASDRVVDIVHVSWTDAERSILNKAAHLRAGSGHKALSASVYRRALSSPFALEQALMRARETIYAMHISDKYAVADDAVVPSRFSEDAARLVAAPQAIDTLMTLLEETARDSKWAACAEVIDGAQIAGQKHVAVFCEFRDTAEYLAQLLEDGGWTLFVVDGHLHPDARRALVADYRERGGVLVLVDAVVDSITLPFAVACIHYDVPWSVGRLAVRFGRTDRVAAPGAVRHVFLFGDTEGERALMELVSRLMQIDNHAPGSLTDLLEQDLGGGEGESEE